MARRKTRTDADKGVIELLCFILLLIPFGIYQLCKGIALIISEISGRRQ
jgi:hypothetical protein|nr:MAG TPA: hypothetical protein [Caudoviricetes sp.]